MTAPATLRELLADTARRLAAAGIETARLDARLLIGHVTGLDAAALLAHRDDAVPSAILERVDPLVARRTGREPMAHILGEREFWSLPFRVTADTLVPRPDTETLVQAVLDTYPAVSRGTGMTVLDLGTGTGCILLALLSEWPEATGIGVDIGEGAVAVARDNAQRLGLADRARFLISDWGEGLDTRFDLIVSNPPYIRCGEIASLEPEVARFDPWGALSGGDDGLDAYRSLAGRLAALMAPKAAIFLEIGWDQESEVTAILRQVGLEVFETHCDLAGRPRCLAAREPSL